MIAEEVVLKLFDCGKSNDVFIVDDFGFKRPINSIEEEYGEILIFMVEEELNDENN